MAMPVALGKTTAPEERRKMDIQPLLPFGGTARMDVCCPEIFTGINE